MGKYYTTIPVSANILFENLSENDLIFKLGWIAGVAYQSEDNSLDTCKKRLAYCMRKGHDSVLEHHSITLSIVVDRATTHALVRHRHTAYTQESTIYCTYKDKLQFVDPVTIDEHLLEGIAKWYLENTDNAKVKRDILPNMTKTQLVMTTNIREWRHIIGLRSDPKDSSRMHDVIELLHYKLRSHYPFFFDEVPQVWK